MSQISIDWADFFVATAGAAGSLAGLLIVAVSVNLKAILGSPSVPERAAATVATVTLALATAIAALIPHQPAWLLAGQVLLYAATALAFQLRALHTAFGRTPHLPARLKLVRLIDGPLPVLPFLAAGALLLVDAVVGLDLLAIGTILALVATIENGWVLLIEILR